ncbi:hypothetical protein BDQ17DRAFT_530774 [Cyathus striatus]|nr:hypothetical protein BDQ17DRAFT_530774 [Cyathus striatus]
MPRHEVPSEMMQGSYGPKFPWYRLLYVDPVEIQWICILSNDPPQASTRPTLSCFKDLEIIEFIQYNPPTMSLPCEVLEEIILYLPSKTKATLIGVSRMFRAICTPDVYRKLSLKNIPSLILLCNILSWNEGALEAVRNLCLDIVDDRGSPARMNSELRSAENKLLQNTLRNLSEHLHELVILALPADLESFIPRKFPKLRSYVSALPVTADTVSFIQQNSHIRELRLFGFSTSQLPRCTVHLPNLQQFIAYPELVPILLPGSSPSNTVLLFRPSGTKEKFDDALRGIGSLDNGRIVSIGFNCTVAHLWIFPAIPQYLPQVTTLYFAVSVRLGMLQNVYSGIAKMVPHLKKLQKIEIVGLEYSTEDCLSSEVLDEESEQLKSWSGLGDTLCRVVMPTKTLWARADDGSSTWLPLSNKPAHTQWLSQRPGYKEMAENLLRTDTKAEFHEVVMGPLLHMESVAGRKFGYVYVPRSQSGAETS